jgi:uncharacterized protein (TIGR02246 family)
MDNSTAVKAHHGIKRRCFPMFRRYSMVLAVMMLLVVGFCAKAFAQMEDDIVAINELYSQYALAHNTGDAALYASLFTEDAVVMASGYPATLGKEQIRADVEMFFDLFNVELPVTVDEVGVPGDWAFARCSYPLSTTPKEGGETTTRGGRELSIFKRQADGSWKFHINSYNYDAPPPTAKRAGTSQTPGRAKRAQGDDADAMYREMGDLYTLAVEAGDIDLYMATYTDDGVQMPPDEPTRIGSAQIRAAMEPALTLFDIEIPIYPQGAEITGDWAFGRCDYSLSLTPKEGGPTTTFPAKDLDVLKRQADGSWKLYISSFSYNGPPTVTSVEATSWGQIKEPFK